MTMIDGSCKDGKVAKNKNRLRNGATSQGISVIEACCGCGGGIILEGNAIYIYIYI